jgi:hypothetical protein
MRKTKRKICVPILKNKYIIKAYPNHYVPEEVLISDLQKTAAKLGKKRMSYLDYERRGSYNGTTERKRFGSWNKALLKAGLKTFVPVSKEELLLNLKHVWDKLKRQPLKKEMLKPLSQYSISRYTTRFGSWIAALETFAAKQQAKGKAYGPLIDYISGRRKNGKGTERNYVSKSMRFDVMKRDNFRCRLCGASPATDTKAVLHIDHIIPLSRGGKNMISNLWTLCKECNYGKRDKTL